MNEYKKENVHGSTHTRSQSSLPTTQDYNTLNMRHKALERVCEQRSRTLRTVTTALVVAFVLIFYLSCSLITSAVRYENEAQAMTKTFNDRLINGHTAQDFGE